MSTKGVSGEPSLDDVAAAVRDAGFVRLVARADGDALAATGLLARACSDAGVPFQASVAATRGAAAERLRDADGLALAVGTDPPASDRAVAGGDRPTTAAAAAIARELGVAPDPVLALAGVAAAGESPGNAPDLLERARDTAGVEQRPGLAVPTDDLDDGLAHSTLVHGTFSARPAAAAALVDRADDGRELASLVAVETAGDEAAVERAATALDRGLRPYATPDGPFATVGGHADVLDALARTDPGTGVALALSPATADDALAAWRDHARSAHEALRAASTSRYDGLFVARVAEEFGDGDDGGVDGGGDDKGGDGVPVVTAARLLADYRSPEPVGLVVADGEAAVVARPSAAPPTATLRDAAAALSGEAGSVARGSYARFDGSADRFVAAFREER